MRHDAKASRRRMRGSSPRMTHF